MLGYTEVFTSVSGRYLVSTFQAFQSNKSVLTAQKINKSNLSAFLIEEMTPICDDIWKHSRGVPTFQDLQKMEV